MGRMSDSAAAAAKKARTSPDADKEISADDAVRDATRPCTEHQGNWKCVDKASELISLKNKRVYAEHGTEATGSCHVESTVHATWLRRKRESTTLTASVRMLRKHQGRSDCVSHAFAGVRLENIRSILR